MCFRSATRTIAAAALLGAMLGGCSEYYFDRRDTITLHSGEAMAANRVTQMIDPWPPASGQRNIAYNGEKAAAASSATAPAASSRRSTPPPVRRQRVHAGAAAGAVHGEQCQASLGAERGRKQQQQPDEVRTAANIDANEQVLDREQHRRGGADRRSGVRAVGARDVRRERGDRAAHRLRHRRQRGQVRHRRRHRRHHRSRRRPPDEMAALERMMLRNGAWPPVVVVTQSFDAEVARSLLQMRVADFLVKPVQPVELVRTCARVARSSGAETNRGADLHLPARGRRRRRHHAGDPDRAAAAQQRPRGRPTTCLVDLDFQHGACADYLDLEPRLDLERDRAAAGAARPAAARSHAVAPRLRASR